MIKLLDNEMTEIEFGYIVGIIDGEGSIYISKAQVGANKKCGCISPVYQTVISITNTNEGLIDWLVAKLGGKKRKYTFKQTPLNSRKPVFTWHIHGARLTEFCEAILPHSVFKQEEIKIMIAMRSTYKTHAEKGKQGIQQLKIDTLNFRQRCYENLKALHNRPNLNHANLNKYRS